MAEIPSDTMDAGEKAGDALVGRSLAGKYRLEKLLGEGGMGAVYRARQLALEKSVAVKVMHKELASDPTFAARFHREAKAASRLDHQNSIRILDFGEEPDGLLYIAMEFLDGRDLLSIIEQESPLSAKRIVSILAQVLTALGVAHEMGVIHRDLKPENIMVLNSKGGDDEGEADVVKVCDFGIAKVSESGEAQEEVAPARAKKGKLTTAGLVIGTPEYMSPEQGRGETLDARSDLYSVGVILYYLLAGRTPFDAPTPLGIVVKHQSEEPLPPSRVRADADLHLEQVCLKALQKRPADRFASAKEMRAALRAAIGSDAPMYTAPMNAAHARTELQMPAVSTPVVVSETHQGLGGELGGGLGGVIVRPPEERAKLARAETAAAITAPVEASSQSSSRRWGIAAAVFGALVVAGSVGAFFLYPMHDRNESQPKIAAATAAPPPPIAPTPPSSTPVATAAPIQGPPPPHTQELKGNAPVIQARPSSHERQALTNPEPVLLPTPAPETTVALPVAPAPAPPPPPPAPAIQAPAPPLAPAFDYKSAKVAFGEPNVSAGGLSPGTLMRALGKSAASKVEECFHRSAFSGCWTSGVNIHLEAEESGVVTSVSVSKPPASGLNECVRAALPSSIPQSDTGRMTADIPLRCTASP